jgi:sugar/nucleoside kinase (ribokinase family)
VFHAALAVALGERASDRDAVAFAAHAAALKCLAGPGVLGAPRREAVERAVRGRGNGAAPEERGSPGARMTA